MKVIDTPIEGLKVVESSFRSDHRGTFSRLFCADQLRPLLGRRQIVQINQSTTSRRGSVRGLHFQYPPHAEMKLVRCLRGRVWDVAVDLRRGSHTYLRWYAQELTPSDARMMVIPEGFAHGFQTLEPDSELLYLHTEYYDSDSEGGLRHDDPGLDINWPLPAQDLSPRDLAHPLLDTHFTGVSL